MKSCAVWPLFRQTALWGFICSLVEITHNLALPDASKPKGPVSCQPSPLVFNWIIPVQRRPRLMSAQGLFQH